MYNICMYIFIYLLLVGFFIIILLHGSLILYLTEYSPCFPFTVQAIVVLEGKIRSQNEKKPALVLLVP